MITSDRDAFEAWFKTNYHSDALLLIEDGCYLHRGAGMAWDAWQAATFTERQRSAGIASCYDLGTPEGHAIAKYIMEGI